MRRNVLRTLGAAGAVLAAGGVRTVSGGTKKEGDPAHVVALPYALDALEPYLSAQTVDLHYNKHHKQYAALVNGWVRTEPKYSGKCLEELIEMTKGGILVDESVHGMAALVRNHNLYWQSLKPGGGVPARLGGPLGDAVKAAFGSAEGLRDAVLEKAGQLGVGWVWLTWTGKELRVERTDYHTSPNGDSERALWVLDVWEHAYYRDYGPERAEYVKAVLAHLINWEFAEANLLRTQGKGG